MSKQVRLPEDFVKKLRQNYNGNNDYQRLKAWKNEEPVDKLVELIEKLDNIDVNNSSTSMDSEVVETLVEDKLEELKKRGIL